MKEYLKKNQETYDGLAMEYKARREHPELTESKPAKSGLRLLSYFNQDYSTLKVLEVGSGVGRMLKFFADSGCQTIGVELSYEMARIANKVCPSSLLICQDINSIHFFEKQFHIIYLGAVIHLFPIEDATLLLRQIHTWLADNGVLYVNTTIHEDEREGYFPKKDYSDNYIRYRKYWTEDEFCSFIEKNGFEIIFKGHSSESNRDKRWVGIYCRKEK